MEGVLNPDDQRFTTDGCVNLFRFSLSVHLVCLLFPCRGSYLLKSRCSPRWHCCLVSSGTEPSPRLIAELVEITYNARIYINECGRGEERHSNLARMHINQYQLMNQPIKHNTQQNPKIELTRTDTISRDNKLEHLSVFKLLCKKQAKPVTEKQHQNLTYFDQLGTVWLKCRSWWAWGSQWINTDGVFKTSWLHVTFFWADRQHFNICLF